MVDYVRRPSFPARPLLRPRRMVGDHARLVVARHLARRAHMDRQLRAHRRRRLVAKPRAMADRGYLRRRPPAPLGRASCRESVCPYAWISVVAASLQNTITYLDNH